MPSSAPRTCTNQILRDYLLAALRCAAHPLTTTELRLGAPALAVAGSARPIPPAQETIYRLLRSLCAQGLVVIADSAATRRTWAVRPDPGAASDIAHLEALFAAPAAPVAHHDSRIDRCHRRR